jgi:hypothetical protein
MSALRHEGLPCRYQTAGIRWRKIVDAADSPNGLEVKAPKYRFKLNVRQQVLSLCS